MLREAAVLDFTGREQREQAWQIEAQRAVDLHPTATAQTREPQGWVGETAGIHQVSLCDVQFGDTGAKVRLLSSATSTAPSADSAVASSAVSRARVVSACSGLLGSRGFWPVRACVSCPTAASASSDDSEAQPPGHVMAGAGAVHRTKGPALASVGLLRRMGGDPGLSLGSVSALVDHQGCANLAANASG